MGIGLQRAAAQKSRVIFTGEWGDAWLQGSRTYYAEELAQGNWRALYDCFKTDAVASGTRQATKWLIRYGLIPLLPFPVQRGLRRTACRIRGGDSAESLFWLTPRMRETMAIRRKQFQSEGRQRVRGFYQRELLDMLNSALGSQVMERLNRRAAHAHLEMRHPLGDPRIVQFAFSTPERLRLRGDRSKYVHVRAMEGLMPDAILERRTKAEFSVVFREHLDGMQGILAEALARRQSAWVTQEGLARLFKICHDKPQLGWPLWVLWAIYGTTSMPK